MKSYRREKDGTTYYYRKILVGHPTNADGTCDFDKDVEVEVDAYAEPLTKDEINQITKKL